MTANGFDLDPRTARQALAILRPGETESPADPAQLVGRLVATVELAAGSGGRCKDWARFDVGYGTAVPAGQQPVVVLKRLMRSVRQLTELPGATARNATTGLMATTSVLFAEILLADDRATLTSALEQMEEARTLFEQALTQLTGLIRMLRGSLPSG